MLHLPLSGGDFKRRCVFGIIFPVLTILTKKEVAMSKNIDKASYKRFAEAHAPSSPILKDCVFAFMSGGVVCCIGEALCKLYGNFLNKKDASLLVSVSLIVLAAFLTGTGIFDSLARHGGAGLLVPITGFANAVASQALDTKSEGFIFGVGAKIFSIAGPVILYGCAAGTLYGFIYYFYNLIFI